MTKKKEAGVLVLAKKELRKERRERIVILFLFSLTLIVVSSLLIFLSSKLIMTGYYAYLESKAGYVTEVRITRKIPATYWLGIYGLALRVPGFTEQMYEDIQNGYIERVDVFFDCIQSDAVGGTEVYASTSPTIDFDNLQPATPQQVDSYTGCSGKRECAVNTFLENMSVMVGSRNISGIPATHTYKYDGQNNVFDLGILNDSKNLVYVTHIEDIQRGFSYEKIVNFQMLLPARPNSTERYYFFTDPNDECPEGGGIGENINASVYGYIKDTNGVALANVSVSVAGSYGISDSNGFYNFSFLVTPGTYNLIATKDGYDPYFANITITFSNNSVEKNITMSLQTPGSNETIMPYVYGYVFDESGNALSGVNVYLDGVSNTSDSSGFYSFYPTVTAGEHAIIATKDGYDNYYSILNFTANTTSLNHNITLSEAVISYEGVGPYTTGPYTESRRAAAAAEAQKRGEDYWISAKEIKKEVRKNTFVKEVVGIYNFAWSTMNLVFSLSPELEDFVKLDKTSVSIPQNSFANLILTIYGTKPIGSYNGTLKISGSIEKEIPIIIKIVEGKPVIKTLLVEIELLNKVVAPGDNLKYKLGFKNLLRSQGYKINFKTYVSDKEGNVYSSEEDSAEIENSLILLKNIKIPKNISEGNYFLNVECHYLNYFSKATAPFKVSKPIYFYSFLGIPLWLIFALVAFISFVFLNFFIYKKYEERKKRYRIAIDFDSLPKPGDRVVRIGNIAESNIPAYYELEMLTTHAIVAGATGMGKSIAAQVIAEEALLNNVAVIVFDPTAQWSGMLRKCSDKKMLSYYPKFGMKESDARAFKGNVRQVKNARELIDIKKYMNPGQIQVFILNKLDPKDIDIFVANVIRQVFKANLEESPNLRLLLIFDEVHRLLSKFGGSGEGFLQIERACREFRKWGVGVILISQVLSDFVGEIKANINTEIQTRTLEESDLERIRTKYGEEFLKTLVRAEVGVAMFQNAEYNHGRPYFINFRPILHNTRRLSDEELEKYNEYNDIIDDLEYQIEQLEQEKVDVFDLRMELKLVKDKLMSGSFSVVDIYLESLKPRIEKEWDKLGKKPKKREIKLVAEEEIKKSVEEAKKERAKIEKKEKEKEEKKEVEEGAEKNKQSPEKLKQDSSNKSNQ